MFRGDKMIEPIVDVSTWQGDINKEKMLSAKPLGMYIRAGSINKDTGKCYEDYQFRSNAEKFGGEIPLGYYWYFRPEHSGIVQATYFVNLMKSVRVDLPPAIDVESNDKGTSMGIFQDRLYEFISITEDLMAMEDVIYTRGSFWNTHVGNPSWAGKRKLWIALYNTFVQHPWIGSPSYYRPAPWNDFWAWQWSADGNGRGAEFGVKSFAIDINRYNGTLEQFHKDANWNQEPLLPPSTNNFCKIIHTIKGVCDRWLAENC
jgi:GH25 family lysozyme M1 (1,4-beta-N-acetylmuramidase)